MKRPVLIADGQEIRRGRLADGLAACGVEVEQVGDGASALELALSRLPTLVIADIDLPLVDAPKLAEIMRANPRTRAARFVFVGDGARFVNRCGPGDVLLPADSAMEDIVATVKAELEILRRLTPLMGVLGRGEPPSGNFPDLSLPEVLHCLHVWKRSGRLEIQRKGGDDGQECASLWLMDGELVEAELGETTGRKALYRVLEWEQGRFALDPSATHTKRFPLGPLRPMLLEGLRQNSEGRRLAAQMPSLEAEVRLRVRAADLPSILHPLTREVLSLLEVHGSVLEVVDNCSYPDYQVLRTLSTLADRQIVHLGKGRTRVQHDHALFDDHQVRRLCELALSEPVRSGRADLKLLVAASCPAALADFAGVLRGIPGASLAPGFDVDAHSGLAIEDQFGPLGRLELDADVGIEFLHVPIRKELAPLWPIAGARALGSLFLLSGSVGEAAARVQPTVDALRCLPHSRIFNLFLFQKGALSARELGENMSLIDEASLFMVPLEGDRAPMSLLRSVFSRIVP